jgi:hypothetical protein
VTQNGTSAMTIGDTTPAAGFAFVYVATGTRYVAEAVRSAVSCRVHMPNRKILLLTPDEVDHEVFDVVISFGRDIGDPFLLKIAGIAAAGVERFVFLDTDTYLLDDISELDELLDRFDIAAAHAPVRLQSNLWPQAREFLEGIPICFPEYNTGVIALRNSPRMRAMFAGWKADYLVHTRSAQPPRTQDQASFRSAVYRSELRIATLPPEYNCRFNYPVSVCGKVKLLHGRGDLSYLDRVGREVNRKSGFRVVTRDSFLADSLILRDQQRPPRES